MATPRVLLFGIGCFASVASMLAVAACGSHDAGGETGDGCDVDTDCKGDRVCTRGICFDPSGGAEPTPGGESKPSPNGNGNGASGNGGDCELSCANEIVLCEKQCDGTPACSYYDWQYDTCVQHCEWDLVYPDALLLEIQGCWQLTTDCDQNLQCFLDADCSAYDMPYDGGGNDDEEGGG